MKTGPVMALIGAGSPRLAMGVVESVAARPSLRGLEIRLMDIDAERLEVAAAAARRVMAAAGDPCVVTASTDRRSAIEGAAIVIFAAAVGGAGMRARDLHVPLRHGIVHVKGDTTGPAGIFRALRTVPVVVDLCREMEAWCPKAVLLNLANPLTAVTRGALRESSQRCLGICSAIDAMRLDIAGKLGLDAARLDVAALGVNHLSWMLGIHHDGRDAMQQFLERALPIFLSDLPVSGELYRSYGLFPIPGYKYASEFFPYFLDQATNYGKDLGLEPANPTSAPWTTEGFAPGAPRDGSARIVVDAVESILCDEPRIITLNVPNAGRCVRLAREVVLEGPVYLAGDRCRPLCLGEIPDRVVALLERVVREQELVVQAAVTGDREALFEAFLIDPLVRTPQQARDVMEEMLREEEAWLPRFA